jgi:hypothetical protein
MYLELHGFISGTVLYTISAGISTHIFEISFPVMCRPHAHDATFEFPQSVFLCSKSSARRLTSSAYFGYLNHIPARSP